MFPGSLSTLAGQAAVEAYTEFAPFQPDLSRSYLERRYTNDNSAFLDVGDARLHYRAEGDPTDPTVLLIHGTYSSLHTWEEWTERLTERFHVVRLDLPGFGLTGPREDGDHTLAYLIDTVGRFCDALDLSEIAVAGNSLGGSIAWRLALGRPDLVDRLVLLDAGGLGLLTQFARTLRATGTDLGPRFLTPRILTRMILTDAYSDRSKVTQPLVRRYHDLLLGCGNRRAVIEIARDVAAGRPETRLPADTLPIPTLPAASDRPTTAPDEDDLSSVAVPTLFQWGEDDSWLPVEAGRERAETVPESQFVSYPGVGHAPMEEAPARTVADAIEFLSQ